MQRAWRAGGARIVRGMLAYVVAMAVLAALSPFDFQAIPGRHFALLFSGYDVLLNLLLLFPAGFLFALAAEGRRPLYALGLGLALSFALESAQLRLPSRHANLADVLTNGLGCWAGALVERRLGRFLAGFLSDELVLELPLTGALYVLMPLLMLLALGAGDGPRVWLLLPLALFCTVILTALYRQRFARAGLLPERFAGYVALGFMVLVAPALVQRPLEVAGSASCVGLAVWIGLRRRPQWIAPQRRFEAATVRRGSPWIALYMASSVALCWQERLGGNEPLVGQAEALRLLESVATLTMCGYLGSELSSRTRAPAAALVSAVAVGGAVVGCLLELTWLASHGPLSRGLCIVALAASAVAGALLHRAQISLVQTLRGRRSGAPSGRPSR